MPTLLWSELDVSACLAAAPDVDEYETKYDYLVEREGVVLKLTLWPDESVVALSLTPSDFDEPVADITVLVRGPVRYDETAQRDAVVFEDALVIPGRSYFRIWPDAHDTVQYPNGLDLELTLLPALHVSFKAVSRR